ncbi:hypothetical protein B0H12DRAFT_1239546 [Mycena haematopus]|nr:hypothetical protein B0H12DRAFT_1239546 [Mycena haematopus]
MRPLRILTPPQIKTAPYDGSISMHPHVSIPATSHHHHFLLTPLTPSLRRQLAPSSASARCTDLRTPEQPGPAPPSHDRTSRRRCTRYLQDVQGRDWEEIGRGRGCMVTKRIAMVICRLSWRGDLLLTRKTEERAGAETAPSPFSLAAHPPPNPGPVCDVGAYDGYGVHGARGCLDVRWAGGASTCGLGMVYGLALHAMVTTADTHLDIRAPAYVDTADARQSSHLLAMPDMAVGTGSPAGWEQEQEGESAIGERASGGDSPERLATVDGTARTHLNATDAGSGGGTARGVLHTAADVVDLRPIPKGEVVDGCGKRRREQERGVSATARLPPPATPRTLSGDPPCDASDSTPCLASSSRDALASRTASVSSSRMEEAVRTCNADRANARALGTGTGAVGAQVHESRTSCHLASASPSSVAKRSSVAATVMLNPDHPASGKAEPDCIVSPMRDLKSSQSQPARDAVDHRIRIFPAKKLGADGAIAVAGFRKLSCDHKTVDTVATVKAFGKRRDWFFLNLAQPTAHASGALISANLRRSIRTQQELLCDRPFMWRYRAQPCLR